MEFFEECPKKNSEGKPTPGNRVRVLREQAGMTQAELGKLLNVRDAAISKYESGKIPLTGERFCYYPKFSIYPSIISLETMVSWQLRKPKIIKDIVSEVTYGKTGRETCSNSILLHHK